MLPGRSHLSFLALTMIRGKTGAQQSDAAVAKQLSMDEFTLSFDVELPSNVTFSEVANGLENLDNALLVFLTQFFLEDWYGVYFINETGVDVRLSPGRSPVILGPGGETFAQGNSTGRWLKSASDLSIFELSYLGTAIFTSDYQNYTGPTEEELQTATFEAFQGKNGEAYMAGLLKGAPKGLLGYATGVTYRLTNDNSTQMESPSMSPTIPSYITPETSIALPLSAGAITGIAIGGLCVFISFFAGLAYIRKSRQKEKNKRAQLPLAEQGSQDGKDLEGKSLSDVQVQQIAEMADGVKTFPQTESESAAILPLPPLSPPSDMYGSPRKSSRRRHMSPKSLSHKFKASLKTLDKQQMQQRGMSSPAIMGVTLLKSGVAPNSEIESGDSSRWLKEVASGASFEDAYGDSVGSSIAPPSVGSDDDALIHLGSVAEKEVGEQQNSEVGSDLDLGSITEMSGLDEVQFNSVLQFQIPASVSQDQDDKAMSWGDDKSGHFSLGYSMGSGKDSASFMPKPLKRHETGGTATYSDGDYNGSVDIGDDTLSLDSKSSIQRLEAKFESLISSVNNLDFSVLLPTDDITSLSDKTETQPPKPKQSLDLESDDDTHESPHTSALDVVDVQERKELVVEEGNQTLNTVSSDDEVEDVRDSKELVIEEGNQTLNKVSANDQVEDVQDRKELVTEEGNQTLNTISSDYEVHDVQDRKELVIEEGNQTCNTVSSDDDVEDIPESKELVLEEGNQTLNTVSSDEEGSIGEASLGQNSEDETDSSFGRSLSIRGVLTIEENKSLSGENGRIKTPEAEGLEPPEPHVPSVSNDKSQLFELGSVVLAGSFSENESTRSLHVMDHTDPA